MYIVQYSVTERPTIRYNTSASLGTTKASSDTFVCLGGGGGYKGYCML